MFRPISIAMLTAAATMAHAGSITLPPVTPMAPMTFDDPEPSLFLGLTWTFGNGGASEGDAGITLKVLSSNEKDKVAGIAGVTWNFDGSFGCDVGIAYVFSPAVLGGSYDFCKQGFQLSVGGTDEPKTRTITPAPAPSPS